jgi:hypothetical protein
MDQRCLRKVTSAAPRVRVRVYRRPRRVDRSSMRDIALLEPARNKMYFERVRETVD